MSDGFDPYREWLGIVDAQRPPGLYVLLGLPPFEADADRIEQAVLRRTFAISDHLDGPHREWAEKLLGQIQQAEGWLTSAARKAEYDALLRESQSTPSALTNGKHGLAKGSGGSEESNDAPVMLVEVDTPEEAPIVLIDITEQPPAAPADMVVLLEVAASPTAKAAPAVPGVSAAEIAEKILRDDVKPQFVPQRASAVKRPPQRGPQPATAATRDTEVDEAPAPPRPQQPPERFDSLRPMPKAAPTASPVKISADAQTLLARPLLSRTDVIAATKGQLPQYDPASEKRRLSEMDVSVLFEAISLFLNRYPKTISTLVLLALVPWLVYRFYPRDPPTAPPQPPVAVDATNREELRQHTRDAADYIRLLGDSKAAAGSRSRAAEKLSALPVDAFRKFRSSLEDLLQAEQDEPTKAELQAALEKIKQSKG